jgi:hypothetical protein
MTRSDEAAARSISHGRCPDCGYRGFILGPKGGAAQNIECGNVECRARWNVTTFGGACVFAQRIPREDEGGSHWGTSADTRHDGDRIVAGPLGWP